MRIVIAGGSGFLGRALTERLIEQGHRVVLLSREADSFSDVVNLRVVRWSPNGESGAWAGEIDGADAVVNLAGASIERGRWSTARKQVLEASRMQSTRSLAAAIRTVKTKPHVFIQGSAMGFYGAHDNGGEFDESASPGSDFLARLCVAWEGEAQPVAMLGCRLVVIRTGIVLSRKGGALAKLLPSFRMFVGGRIATGKQSMSWVHLDDWVGMVVWAIANPAVSGPVNATAPHPVTNAEFSRALGRALHRPAWTPVPGAALKLALGQMATDMLIRGQRVLPRRAIQLGYQFRYERIDEALVAAVR